MNSKTKPADSSKNDSNNEGREDEVALAAAVADSDEMGSHHSNDDFGEEKEFENEFGLLIPPRLRPKFNSFRVK